MRKFLFLDREAPINEKLRKSLLRWIGHVQNNELIQLHLTKKEKKKSKT